MAIDFMSAGGAVLDTTTAGAEDIKSGKTAYNGDGELVTGTMVDQGAKTASLAPGGSYTIPAGYHNGSGKVTANSVSLSGNANAAQVLSGYTFYKDNYNTKLTGSMTNRGAVSATVYPGGSYTIPAGYHNGSGKVTAKSLKTVTVSITKNLWNYTVNGTLVGFSNLGEGAAVVGRIYISGNTAYYENKTGGTTNRTITLVYY